MTEPEQRDPARRPRNMDLAVLTWAAAGVGLVLLLVVNLLSGVEPAAPANSGALFGGLAVLWCSRGLRMGWRGPRLVLAVGGVVLAYLAVSLPLPLLAEYGVVALPRAVGVVLVGLLASAGTVLMFQPDVNAYVREMTRRQA